MILTNIEPSKRLYKRYMATFELDNGKYKYIHFGLKDPKIGTYIDHKNKKIRDNYISRHSVLEKEYLKDPTTPASLSMYILWGPYTDINKNINYFKKKFNV